MCYVLNCNHRVYLSAGCAPAMKKPRRHRQGLKIGLGCRAGLRPDPPFEAAGETPGQQRGDSEADKVEQGRLNPVSEQQWRSGDQGDNSGHRDALSRPPLPPRPLRRVAHRLVGSADGHPHERLQVGYDPPARAVPRVAAHVYALPVRPLPKCQTVRATAVADRRSPEPAPVEADPVGIRSAICAALGPMYSFVMSVPSFCLCSFRRSHSLSPCSMSCRC